MPAPILSRNVQTELNYATSVPGNAITTDFTQPGAEEAYAAFEKKRKTHTVTVHDLRGREDDFKLFENGFQYVHDEVEALRDCETEEQIAEVLVPATETLVKRLTGATKTVTFLHRIRNKESDEAKRGDNRAPANAVHSDFTPAGALRNLEKVIKDPEERETLLKGRILSINVWRPLKTIRKDPLAVCDWKSVDYHRDWIKNRFIFPDFWAELGAVVHNENHRWCFLNHQSPAEPLVFTQLDSNKFEDGGMCTGHTAFVDPEYQDAEIRESIEIKLFAFLPEEAK